MSTAPTRTEAVEMAHDEIMRAERAAIALDTGARAYTDIAVHLEARPTYGEIADECIAEMVMIARQKAQACRTAAETKRAVAARIRGELS